MQDETYERCPLCEGSCLRVIERADGSRAAVECACKISRRGVRQFEAARIPERYRDCTLDNFTTNRTGPNESFERAVIQARGFVRNLSWTLDGDGLLITGPVGVGKTHLAVGILQALISEKGVKGLFVHGGDLLKQVQDSYNRSANVTEREILRPIFAADVLVLDELGAARRTDWVAETIEHILNTRYNDCKATIITTNFANASGAGTHQANYPGHHLSQSVLAARQETLGDRIGERMRSRLQEMCTVIEMNGSDYREQLKRKQTAEGSLQRVRPAGRVKLAAKAASTEKENSVRHGMSEPEEVFDDSDVY